MARMLRSDSEKALTKRLSVPGAGIALTTVTEERAKYVRQAVSVLAPFLGSETANSGFIAVFGARWRYGEVFDSTETLSLRSAWALVSMWLVGRLVGAISDGADYRDAEHWFLGRFNGRFPSLVALIPSDVCRDSLEELRRLDCDDGSAELLPYILDAHGPGSRLSVMREPRTQVARSAKRRDGVFYTPADVAEYMATEVLKELGDATQAPKCLDASCGSGVFLRALLRIAEALSPTGRFDRFAFARSSLYGLDISPLAIESACFVLLHDAFRGVSANNPVPWVAWHLLRLNFAVVNSLSVTRAKSAEKQDIQERARISGRLIDIAGTSDWKDSEVVRREPKSVGFELFEGLPGGLPVTRLFPEAGHGFDVLIGNPPYSALGKNRDERRIVQNFASFPAHVTGSEQIYAAFIEMLWRLTAGDDSASALVVPLSIAYHRGKSLTACRRAIMRDVGDWRFAFFDREPHALFGEDVKTRNAILFRSVRNNQTEPARGPRFQTGPLRKWTSRNRVSLFSSLDFTPLTISDIASGIPKLSGEGQSQAAASLMARSDQFKHGWRRIHSCRPSEACCLETLPVVFVASTAYNFLNVFRPHNTCPELRAPMSENKLFRMEYESEGGARVSFAVLSSRLVYWWWHVHGDGFHVPRWFLESIPFCHRSFHDEDRERLGKCAERLWERLQEHQVVSLNRNRVSIAYRPLSCESERDEIDSILIRAAGMDSSFCQELRRFVRDVVIVDNTDERRQHLRSHFGRVESVYE